MRRTQLSPRLENATPDLIPLDLEEIFFWLAVTKPVVLTSPHTIHRKKSAASSLTWLSTYIIDTRMAAYLSTDKGKATWIMRKQAKSIFQQSWTYHFLSCWLAPGLLGRFSISTKTGAEGTAVRTGRFGFAFQLFGDRIKTSCYTHINEAMTH